MPTLSHRINAATRPEHTHLNNLIITLLPLALPPNNPSPILYARGLAHILPIYEACEGAFRLLLVLRNDPANDVDGGKRILLLKELRKLHMPELERTKALHRDIERLLGKSSCNVSIDGAATPRLKAFTRHVRAFASSKPQLLLAYCWVFYMALFSGGRYIRSKLQAAGPAFWGVADSEKVNEFDGCLSFWAFEGEEDGEDIKADFKRRFADVDGCLTEPEREEVVQEATYIMDAMAGVVEEIAEVVGGENTCLKTAGRRLSEQRRAEEDQPSMRWLLFKHVLPMGMVELIAGASKAVQMGVEPLYGGN